MAAHTIFFFALMVIGGTALFILLSPVINEFITMSNVLITGIGMSDTYFTYQGFNIGLWLAVPFILVVSLGLWGVVRIIELRGEFQ